MSDDVHSRNLTDAILTVANEIRESRHQSEREFEHQVTHLATKTDLEKLGELIMSLVKDLGAQLATVDDALDKILKEIQDLESNLSNISLPADAQQNLDRLTAVVTAIQNVLQPATGGDVVTLDSIANQTASVGGGAQTVPLTGIGTNTAGKTLTATVVSSDTTIVPSPTVALDPAPAKTGTVTFTPGVAGVATLTVTISDGTSQAVKLFTVTVA